MTGPLKGIAVVSLGGQGPVPFASMLFSDLGADVVRMDRPVEIGGSPPLDALLRRGQRSIAVDLKSDSGRQAATRLVDRADVVLEGFRPGVAERLGLGPDESCARNQGLVYGRMTGYGQDGPLAQAAGHDINYLALSGLLGATGAAGSIPRPPLNVAGDFGGGALFLVVGILAALQERALSGRGQVVDAAMTDGLALLMGPVTALWSTGGWVDERDSNFMDGSAPFYRCYETADRGYVAVGAVEPGFFEALLNTLGFDDPSRIEQWDQERWPGLAEQIGAAFSRRTRDEWVAAFSGVDACVTPVLGVSELASHPHAEQRGTYAVVDGLLQPQPAPRYSRTTGRGPRAWARPGEHTEELLRELGLSESDR